jgi:very-short-patch-repair endonuclease
MSEHLELEAAWISLGEATMPVVARCLIGSSLREICESPIEVIFGAAFLLMFPEYPLVLPQNAARLSGPALIPQFWWNDYRIDWAIRTGGTPAFVFVECDGREFHSTPDQIARDKRKDQAALEAGIPLLRFSGSDINKHFDHCAMLAMAEAARAQADAA